MGLSDSPSPSTSVPCVAPEPGKEKNSLVWAFVAYVLKYSKWHWLLQKGYIMIFVAAEKMSWTKILGQVYNYHVFFIVLILCYIMNMGHRFLSWSLNGSIVFFLQMSLNVPYVSYSSKEQDITLGPSNLSLKYLWDTTSISWLAWWIQHTTKTDFFSLIEKKFMAMVNKFFVW